MLDQQVTGIRESLRKLFSSAVVECTRISRRQLTERYPNRPTNAPDAGHAIDRDRAYLWIPLVDDNLALFEVSRPGLGLSDAERRCLKHFPRAAQGILVTAPTRVAKIAERLASRYSFEHILIARFLRGTAPANSLWTPALVVNELQDLSFQRYEGQPCTSGFIFISEPTLYLSDKWLDRLRSSYEYDPFSEELFLEEQFFQSPATYRYIDGRNSFYVIDNFRRVYGIVRIRHPGRFSRSDRVAYRHITPLLETPRGRAWAGTVGPNHAVDFVLSDATLLRWSHFHWHLFDRRLLLELLETHHVSGDVASTLADALFTLSDMKLGTLILISDESGESIRSAGRIDHSHAAEMLALQFSGRTLVQMMSDLSALGVLSSDGLTVITTAGTIAATGLIIDLSQGDGTQAAGGGRTQAARVASNKGLVLKVSADGPVSAYYLGREVLRYEY